MYQDTAYNTDKLIEQKEGEALGYWQKKFNSGRKFSHVKASSDIPINSFKGDLPSDEIFKLRDDALKEKDDDAKEMFWTEKVLSQQAFSPFSQFYLILVGLCKIFTWFMFPFFQLD